MTGYEECERAAAELMLSWKDWPSDDEPAEAGFDEVCEAYGIAEGDRRWARSALAEMVAKAEEGLEGI